MSTFYDENGNEIEMTQGEETENLRKRKRKKKAKLRKIKRKVKKLKNSVYYSLCNYILLYVKSNYSCIK